jgi:signal transduction histidine kinase
VLATVLAGFLLQEAEDRRLREAGVVLVNEIAIRHPNGVSLTEILKDEHEETRHAAMGFAVLEADRTFVAGDEHLDRPGRGRCKTDARGFLRACSVGPEGGLIVVAASSHTPQMLPFAFAALVAVAASGLMTWLSSRPMARAAVLPFSRLRARLAAIDVNTIIVADLGPDENVEEVDMLRATISQLIDRVGSALEQAQRFSSNAAHELRTPLTAVRAELELLAEHRALPEGWHEPVARLRGRVAELARLVEKLLVLAAPKRILEQVNEVVSLRDVLEDVVRGLVPEERRRIVLPTNDAMVRGDADLLVALFANGLSNALKFGNSVEVAMKSVAGEVVVDIDDDGPGVDGALRERLFEPFYRGADALRLRVPGHGLGLALVRHVAESHGGTAAFAERPGPGARLQIQLPEMAS